MTNEEDGSGCRHLWVIASPNGPTSPGECKLCGEHSEFKNSMPTSGWDRSGPGKKKAKQTPN